MKGAFRAFRVASRILFLLFGLVVLPGPAGAVTQYAVIDLGTLPGGSESWAWDVNVSGQVVGQSFYDGGTTYHAFLWDGGVMQDLGTFGGAESRAYGVNASGQVVGFAQAGSNRRAFLWEGDTMQDLGTLGGAESQAEGISTFGQVVGWADVDGDVFHAFLWVDDNENGQSDPGEMRDLGTLGGDCSWAYGVNDSGRVVGWADPAGGGHRAFLWHDEVMQDLGTLGGGQSWAYAVNSSSQVVGCAVAGNGNGHAFLWVDDNENGQSDPGEMRDLGTLDHDWSWAYDINDSGQVVGEVKDTGSPDDPSAFLWQEGVMYNLNDLVPDGSAWICEAHGINDQGQIVGWGKYDGQIHAVLLTPIPEPSVPGLLSLALLVFMRRLRRS